MSQKRLSMRKIRELMRLKYELGRSHREIAASLGVANSTVSDYVGRARAAGLSWPLPEGLDDAALEAALFPPLPPSGSLVRSRTGTGCTGSFSATRASGGSATRPRPVQVRRLRPSTRTPRPRHTPLRQADRSSPITLSEPGVGFVGITQLRELTS